MPLFICHVDQISGAAQTGIVNDNVRVTECLSSSIKQAVNICLISNITETGCGPLPGFAFQASCRIRQTSFVDVRNQKTCTFFDTPLRGGIADACPGRSGDNDALCLQKIVACYIFGWIR